MTGHLGDVKSMKHWGALLGGGEATLRVARWWGNTLGTPLLGMVATLQHASKGHPQRAASTGGLHLHPILCQQAGDPRELPHVVRHHRGP